MNLSTMKNKKIAGIPLTLLIIISFFSIGVLGVTSGFVTFSFQNALNYEETPPTQDSQSITFNIQAPNDFIEVNSLISGNGILGNTIYIDLQFVNVHTQDAADISWTVNIYDSGGNVVYNHNNNIPSLISFDVHNAITLEFNPGVTDTYTYEIKINSITWLS